MTVIQMNTLSIPMITRTRNTLVVFAHPFELRGIDRTLPPGEISDRDRRAADRGIVVPGLSPRRDHDVRAGSVAARSPPSQTVTIDPRDLEAAQERDKAMPPHSPGRRSHEPDDSTLGPARPGGVDQAGIRMTKDTIDLDDHRGMAAQKATGLRRLLADVEANEQALPAAPGRAGSPSGRSPGGELARGGREGALSPQAFCRLADRARPAQTEADCRRAR